MIVGSFLLYAWRHPDPTLFYLGAAVEVPQGRAIAVMNPFRDKTSERTAEHLIRDLKTGDCLKIIMDFGDGNRICPAIQGSIFERLVWREDNPSARVLVYDLTGKGARLWITFNRDEGGFGVRSVSLIH
jgi:hypothetical protein